MANENSNNRRQLDAVEAVQSILNELKGRAQEAEKTNDVYVFGIYNKLVKVVSPIACQAFARQQREQKAEIAKTDKRMRDEARKAKEAAIDKKQDTKPTKDGTKPA